MAVFFFAVFFLVAFFLVAIFIFLRKEHLLFLKTALLKNDVTLILSEIKKRSQIFHFFFAQALSGFSRVASLPRADARAKIRARMFTRSRAVENF
ncbi:MAG: hypothetical protein NDJ89_03080 [Oligoflexia bacterium]|nr:hypothetical protein [Oligoflexia bacterium]